MTRPSIMTSFIHIKRNKQKTNTVYGFMQNCFISIFPFSYICCVINRHEEPKLRSCSRADPAHFVLFFFLHTANNFS